MKMIKLISKTCYKLYVVLFCCILNTGVLNASNRLDVDTTVYVVADEGPKFKGDMTQWIGENVQYPQVAWDNGIMGKVIVAFIVEKDGKVSNVQVVRGVHESLDAEALRVFNKMPAWKPAKINGENVRYRFTCPLMFNIERAVAEPYSYDEFIAMLEREGKIPLENIQEETDPVIIQMYVAQKQQFLKGGESAFKLVLDRMSPSYNVRVPANFIREYKLDKEQQKKLKVVYKWKRLEQETNDHFSLNIMLLRNHRVFHFSHDSILNSTDPVQRYIQTIKTFTGTRLITIRLMSNHFLFHQIIEIQQVLFGIHAFPYFHFFQDIQMSK